VHERTVAVSVAGAPSLPPLDFGWRPVAPADVPTLASLYADAARAMGPRVYSPEQVAAWASCALDLPAFERYILDHDTWVATHGRSGEPLGFCGVEVDGETREVHSLYVRPEVARRGIGTRMLARTLERARTRGARRFAAWATPFSRPVFLRCGFDWTETVRGEFAGVMFERYRVEQG
jgi:putative acetyltransferase